MAVGSPDRLRVLASGSPRRIMHWLIPRSELTIYHGGHLDLITEAGRLAPVVEAFLTAANDPQRQPITLDSRCATAAAG